MKQIMGTKNNKVQLNSGITPDKIRRFEAACDRIIYSAREENGIGTLGEKTLHAVLKNYLVSDTQFHEIKVGRFFADIKCNNEIIEIQTKQFNRLRSKLEAFLTENRVTVVYPIAYEKKLRWVDIESGEISKPHKSPKRGRPQSVFYELYKIKPFLNHENFRLLIVLVNIEEYRFLNGWSQDKKKGSSCSDRIPTALIDEIYLKTPKDYILLIPAGLNNEFTVKEYAKAAKITAKYAQPAVNILYHLGVIERVGKKGNSYIYSVI